MARHSGWSFRSGPRRFPSLRDAIAQTTLSDGDRAFIEQAAQGGQAEVSMGQSAAESKNPAISAFGKQMIANTAR